MHHIPNPNRAEQCPISRRTLLEGSVIVVAAVGGLAAKTLLPGAANAADHAAGDQSTRQLASFRRREAAARSYLDDPQP